jgi:hypothetical protein
MLPVYTARILDVVDWSPAGWCNLILLFREIAVPLVVDVFCVARDPKQVYPPNTVIAFTLDCAALTVCPSTERARIDHTWALAFEGVTDEDYPLVPVSSYSLYGTVVQCDTRNMILDGGLVLEVRPPHGQSFAAYECGNMVCVTGKLGITLADANQFDGPPPTLIRRRPTGKSG